MTSKVGRYDIVAPLAEGGMGEILLGALRGSEGVHRPVVIKKARVGSRQDSAALSEMFIDEARIVASIHHPNVVQCIELGTEGDELFMVMEFVEGETVDSLMRRLLRKKMEIEPDVAAHIIAQVCSGLQAAHELTAPDGTPRELVHRDVSPHNIMVGYDGTVRLIDFGIAKAAGRITKTEAGTLKGKFAYMSPEQAGAQPLDRRSDLFSLGVVLWELTTGRRLFRESSSIATLRAVERKEIPDPSTVREAVPAALDRVVCKALQRDQDERYQDASKMRHALLASVGNDPSRNLPEERLASLMHVLFASRIAAKKKMLAQIADGTPPEVPEVDVDTDIELPTVVAKFAVPVEPKARARVRNALMVFVVAVATSAAAVFMVSSTNDETAPAVQAQPVAPPVVISIDALNTNGARVFRGDREIGVTPFETTVAQSAEPIAITIRREGFIDLPLSIIPTESQRLTVNLDEDGGEPTPVSMRRRRPRTPMSAAQMSAEMTAPRREFPDRMP